LVLAQPLSFFPIFKIWVEQVGRQMGEIASTYYSSLNQTNIVKQIEDLASQDICVAVGCIG